MTGTASTSRRQLLKLTGAAALASTLPGPAGVALAAQKRHGLSIFGDLKYPEGFRHFDYVNPDAPKGGRFIFRAPSWFYNQNPRTFNTFNTFILKGDAPPRMEMCFDTLMVRALDEPDAMYGLLAESAEISEDGNTCTFNLRPEARFHDGSKLTAEDVAFSLIILKTDSHPQIRQILAELLDTQVLDEYTVAVRFTGNQGRQLPALVASMPVFSKRYYTTYDFKQSTLTPPLSSGPYKVGRYEVGRYIDYRRVEDYWAKDLPVVQGHHNFDVIRLEFFRDHQVAFEAFKKGDVTFQEEFSSRIWANDYNFPAVEDGRVVQKVFPDNRPSGAQGWFFNTRLNKFSDPRVRRAIGYAFDFEWSNKSLFYGLYRRTQSFFQNSAMMAEGLPSDEELALLEPHRAQVPASVFEDPYIQPVSDGSGSDRTLLREAARLLREAGFKRDGTVLLDTEGNPFTIEFLSNVSQFERITLPFIDNLKKLGIEASFRLVDPTQYQARVNDFDFDIASRRYGLQATLTEGIRQLWGSASAGVTGSQNMAGIADPVIDDLLETILATESRQEMTIAARALDRVLRSGHYWVPQWNRGTHTVAFWDIFGYPDEPPFYDFPVEVTWWFDEAKAEKIGFSG